MTEGFLGRWSRRKTQARTEEPTAVDEPLQKSLTTDTPSTGARNVDLVEEAGPNTQNTSEEPELPTEEDLAKIEDTADVSAFLQAKVPEALKNQAFKALFKNPKFNHVDMLDVYMEDYNKFVPLTEAMRDKMTFAKKLLSRPDLEEEKAQTDEAELMAETDGVIEDDLPTDEAQSLQEAEFVVDESTHLVDQPAAVEQVQNTPDEVSRGRTE